MTQRIILWTAPRCVSTAFERSIMELENSKIFHEPYSNCFYFGPERQSQRYQHQPPDSKSTYRSVAKLIQKEYDGIDIVFSKDMAYCVDGHFAEFLSEGFADVKHTFLIRNPRKAIPSLHKASINKSLTGWDHFDPIEAGFRQMYELYKFVIAELDPNPLIIDADDLLENPEDIMRSYCEGLGLKFNPKILRWEPGPVPDWDVWAGWHENALKSCGFAKRDLEKKEAAAKTHEEQELPGLVEETIKRSMPFYQEMYNARVCPKIANNNNTSDAALKK